MNSISVFLGPEPCLSGESEDGGQAEGEDPEMGGGPQSLYRLPVPGTESSPGMETVSLKSLGNRQVHCQGGD